MAPLAAHRHSSQSEEREQGRYDNHEADDVDDAVHVISPGCRRRDGPPCRQNALHANRGGRGFGLSGMARKMQGLEPAAAGHPGIEGNCARLTCVSSVVLMQIRIVALFRAGPVVASIPVQNSRTPVASLSMSL